MGGDALMLPSDWDEMTEGEKRSAYLEAEAAVGLDVERLRFALHEAGCMAFDGFCPEGEDERFARDIAAEYARLGETA
jgi:hypothetical protein